MKALKAAYKHDWQLSKDTSPSGKILFHCPYCGLYDPAPTKMKYEGRVCEKDKYKDLAGKIAEHIFDKT